MSVTATEARQRFFSLIEQVNDDRKAVRVSSKRGNAVILSEEEYDSLLATAHLFRSPANSWRLLEADAAFRRGEGDEIELDRS